MFAHRMFLLVLSAGALGACTPYDPNLSNAPFFCGSAEPRCPDGYTCVVGASTSVCMVGSGSGNPQPGTCTMSFSGVLATWSFASESGTQASTAPASSAPGVAATSISRAPTLMAATGTGSINSTNWPSGAQLDPTSYYTLSIAAPSGCALELSSVAIDVKSSTTGPASAAIGTSADGFAQTVAVSTTAPSTPAVTASLASGSLEVRIFGYGASATTGTMRVQNMLAVSGALK